MIGIRNSQDHSNSVVGTPVSPRSGRIVVVTETYPADINGVAMTLGRLVEGLGQRGHQITVVRSRSSHRDQGGARSIRPGIPFPGYQEIRLGVPSRLALRAQWRRLRPELVHIATEGPLGISALLAAHDLGIPTTTSFHTNFDTYARHYGLGGLASSISLFLRTFHNRSRCTMVPTQKQAQHLRSQGYRNVVVLGRGVDTSLFNPGHRSTQIRDQWCADESTLVLLTVGRVAPEKNLALGLKTFENIRLKHPSALWVLVGDGPEISCFRKHPGIRCVGTKRGIELSQQYASADIFLFPSQTETYGNVLPEAMASGLACVAFDYAACREFGQNERDVLAVPLGDEVAFIASAQRLSADETLRHHLGQAACRTAMIRNWSAVIDQFESYITPLISNAPKHR